MKSLDLSVVVPLYNEEESVRLLHERISEALRRTDLRYEILFVDDGSRDGTLEIAAAIAEQDPRLRVVEFRANYGQTPAMAAGIDLARGTVIATMDGDLQNDPGDIPAMLREIDDDTDMVVGWRQNRQDRLLTRKVPSWIANKLIGKVTGVPIRDNGCSLKLYRASVIKRVPLYSEMHRFIPAMASITGARVKEVPVSHHARQFGASKYGLSRTWKVLLDLLSIKTIIGFAQRPLLWFGLLAMPFIVASLISLGAAIAPLFTPDGTLILPFAGTGVLYGALALFLLMGGAVGELVYATGNVDLTEYSRLSAVSRMERDDE
ncbi:MAG TPA: glycosyltransferase family 2 protein [Steroidobacteraceae bacterium]